MVKTTVSEQHIQQLTL